MTDELEKVKLKEIFARYQDASTGSSWLLKNDPDKRGEDWNICSLGASRGDNKPYYITTDRVRASEHMHGDAKADGEFIVNARADIFYLLNFINKEFRP